jgi:hypothetical protein
LSRCLMQLGPSIGTIGHQAIPPGLDHLVGRHRRGDCRDATGYVLKIFDRGLAGVERCRE